MKRILALLALLALAASAPLAAATRPAPRPAAGPDWTSTVSVLPTGAYVLGNPKAKVRIVEYLSLTCPHCGRFSGEAMGPLTANYIAKGPVSLEVRHAIRDSLDIAASLLARCNGPRPFFANEAALFASQEQWFMAAARFEQADKGAIQKLPMQQALPAIAHGAGLDNIMAAHGVPAARFDACLADKKEQDVLAAMTKEAWQTRQIPGTPAFLVNDVQDSSIHDWPTMEAAIKAALG